MASRNFPQIDNFNIKLKIQNEIKLGYFPLPFLLAREIYRFCFKGIGITFWIILNSEINLPCGVSNFVSIFEIERGNGHRQRFDTSNLESRISNLESRISDLESRISDLECRISNL